MEWCQLRSNREPYLLCTVCGEKLVSLGQRSMRSAVSLDVGRGTCSCYFLNTPVNCSKTLVHIVNYSTVNQRKALQILSLTHMEKALCSHRSEAFPACQQHTFATDHICSLHTHSRLLPLPTSVGHFSFLTDVEGSGPL